jgi:hypothetical protein
VANIGDVVVEELAHLEGVLGLGPVAEHDRNGRQYLDVDVLVATFFDAGLRRPAIIFYLTEEFAVLEHARTTRNVVIEVNEATIAKALAKVRDVLGQDVRMDIYREVSRGNLTHIIRI